MLAPGRTDERGKGKTKKPLIRNRISGFGIWLRGQDLNL